MAHLLFPAKKLTLQLRNLRQKLKPPTHHPSVSCIHPYARIGMFPFFSTLLALSHLTGSRQSHGIGEVGNADGVSPLVSKYRLVSEFQVVDVVRGERRSGLADARARAVGRIQLGAPASPDCMATARDHGAYVRRRMKRSSSSSSSRRRRRSRSSSSSSSNSTSSSSSRGSSSSTRRKSSSSSSTRRKSSSSSSRSSSSTRSTSTSNSSRSTSSNSRRSGSNGDKVNKTTF